MISSSYFNLIIVIGLHTVKWLQVTNNHPLKKSKVGDLS